MSIFQHEPGLIIPFIGRRRLPCNKDGSPFDSGEADMLDEVAPFYLQVWVFEWLGFGFPLWPWSHIWDAKTGQPLDDQQ